VSFIVILMHIPFLKKLRLDQISCSGRRGIGRQYGARDRKKVGTRLEKSWEPSIRWL